MCSKDSQRDVHVHVHGIREYEYDPEVHSDGSDDSHYDFLSGIDIKDSDHAINATDDKSTFKRFAD